MNNEANVRKVREPFVRVHGMTTFNIRIFWVKFAAWEMIYRIPNRVRGEFKASGTRGSFGLGFRDLAPRTVVQKDGSFISHLEVEPISSTSGETVMPCGYRVHM